ncbi:MAG TPA: hypothetical protein PLU78_01735 [Chitinophagales bacterium]|nr:hypothetical protein [Chitinophagales bacterium]
MKQKMHFGRMPARAIEAESPEPGVAGEDLQRIARPKGARPDFVIILR